MDSDRDPSLGEPSEAEPEFDFVRAGILFYGTMAVVAVLWRVGLYRESIFFASPEAEAAGVVSLGWNCLLGAAAGGSVIGVSYLFTKLTSWGDELARAMGEALGSLSIPDAILLAFASGLAEEMLFRGALQPRIGLVLASLIFGAIHFVPRRAFYPWTVFAIVVGFFFGALFEWTGNLIAPVLAHTLVNAVNLPLLLKEYRTPQS